MVTYLHRSATYILIHMIYVVLLCSLTYSISKALLSGSSTSLNYRCGKMDGNEINEPTISPFYTVVYVHIYYTYIYLWNRILQLQELFKISSAWPFWLFDHNIERSILSISTAPIYLNHCANVVWFSFCVHSSACILIKRNGH